MGIPKWRVLKRLRQCDIERLAWKRWCEEAEERLGAFTKPEGEK